MHPFSTLITDNILVLNQGVDIFEHINDRIYQLTNPPLYAFGVGSHIRHCLDFYTSFRIGLDTKAINYNLRERNTAIEKDPALAGEELRKTILFLDSFAENHVETPLQVKVESFSDHHVPHDWCGSTVKRELQFLLSHTVHHFALVALILRLNGVEPGEMFGVAPSTLQYWKKAHACAQ